MATDELWMKLLINKKTGKLCFADAGSDVVEFLTGLLSLPLGTVASLLAKEAMVGSVETLLGCAEKLGAKCNSREQNLMSAVAPATLSRLLGVQTSLDGKLYRCSGNYSPYSSQPTICGYVSTIMGSACPTCGGPLNIAMTLTGVGTNQPVVTTTLPTAS